MLIDLELENKDFLGETSYQSGQVGFDFSPILAALHGTIHFFD